MTDKSLDELVEDCNKHTFVANDGQRYCKDDCPYRKSYNGPHFMGPTTYVCKANYPYLQSKWEGNNER